MLGDHYFGDVEAIDEGRNHPSYFDLTFIVPESFSLRSLNNSKKYLIVGRKGAGKTAVQFYLSRQLEQTGFLTHFFSFHSDLKPKDYNLAIQGQKIDMLEIVNSRNIFLNYDFRELWLRTFLIKLAETIREGGYQSDFTKFCLAGRSKLLGIFEGILRSTNVSLSAEMMGISANLGFDFSGLENKEIALDQFNRIAMDLLKANHDMHRVYLFVDELVFSKLDAQDDEVRVRAAMVRDIFRTARVMNNFFHQNDLDFHVICAVRPEIRDLINDLDSEIGKIFDSKSVELVWDVSDGEDSLLYRLLKQKVIHSLPGRQLNFSDFVESKIKFTGRALGLEEFIRINMWARPRDVVQFLSSVSEKSPNSSKIGEGEIKSALNEFGRRSFSEIMEEVSVKNGGLIASKLRQSVYRREYQDYADFEDKVLSQFRDFDLDQLLNDLFHFGVIGNFDDNFRTRRYYWFHRGEEFFKKGLGVAIHPGLWNYFNIR